MGEVTFAQCTQGLMFVFTISPQLTQNIKLFKLLQSNFVMVLPLNM